LIGKSVRLEGIKKKYGQTEALRGVSLRCKEGEFFCLFGPSGAGKTSTLKIIAGIEKATDGNVFIGERLVNEVRPQDREVAMMFENYALYPHLTVFENLAAPLRSPAVKGQYSGKEIQKRVNEVAEMLGISHLLSRYPRQLSGGQKQRVALGRVLVRRVPVFLLDEPISHLDAKLRHEMRVELKRIHKEVGTTFFYATPDQLEAMSMAETVAVIHQGIIQQIGTPEELYNHPANEFVAGFIGEPPMNFFDGELEEEHNEFIVKLSEVAKIKIPDKFAYRLKKALKQRKVRLGIRPTDVAIVKDETMVQGSDDFLRGEVYVCEPLGRYTVATIKVGKTFLKVKMEGYFKIQEGDKVDLLVNRNKLYFFDPQSKCAI